MLQVRQVYPSSQEIKTQKSTLYKSMKHPVDYTGQKIGKLTVIGRSEDLIDCNGQRVIQWECECECGDRVKRRAYHLKRGRCVCHKCKAIEEAKKYGFNDIRAHHWYNIRKQAAKRNLLFNITMEYVWKLYEEQDKKCALTGMDISFAKTKKGHATGETTASLDRIDPSRGYTEGNVQWVHKWVNIIKWDFTQEEFLDICKMVVEHNEQKVETSR